MREGVDIVWDVLQDDRVTIGGVPMIVLDDGRVIEARPPKEEATVSDEATTACEVTLEGETHLISFYPEDLQAMGEDILVFYAWLEDGLLALGATLRGEESPVPDYATDYDGPWFIHDREV